MKSQHEVWNNIAEEWQEFKDEKPSRIVTEFLKDKEGNILDLGSGAGRHLIKSQNIKMHLVDFSEKMIKLAEKKARDKKISAEFKIAPMHKIPYQDNFFDSAIAIASIHCVEGKKNRKKTIEELFRVLKPKAEILVAVWNKKSKRFKNHKKKEKYVGWRDKGLRYYYLFDEDEIYNLFEKAGFTIKDKIESNINIIFVAEKPASF